MAVKYVKDFAFDSGFGFSGSSGKTPVRAYMRGGTVKSNPTKAPSIAPAMVEKRSQGLGGLTKETKKLAAYNKPHMEGKKGAKVATYAKGGAVKKAHAKKEMPSFLKAKMMKKANGGPVAEITEGDGMSPLQAMAEEFPPLKPLPPDDPRLLPSLPPGYEPPPLLPEKPRDDGELELVMMPSRPGYGPDLGGRRMPSIGDAARQMLDLDRISRTGPGAPEPIGELMPLPEEPNYVGPAPRALDMVQVDDMIMTREDAERMRPNVFGPSDGTRRLNQGPAPVDYSDMPMGVMGGGDDYWRKGGLRDQQAERGRQWEISKGLGPMKPGVSAPRLPMAGEPGFGTSKGVKGSPLAEAARMAPQDRRAMRADRREMARDIMDRYIAGPRRAMPAARRAMPVAPSEPMIKIPRAPRGGVATFAKGGKVSKGEKKIGKVMGEFKRGELHSGSKKGPIVTNPKQATAIALSEARAAGAKIPKKKAMGGKACG